MFPSITSKIAFALSGILLLSTAYGSNRQKEIDKLFASYKVKSYNNKCGFHILANYYGTPGDRFGIKGVLQFRPPNETSVVSPSGKFRIHFDTSNVNGNQPFLYDSLGQKIPNSTYAFVDSVEEICDYVYHVEVDSLGFPPPPSDSGAGGGNEYDIYIQALGTGQYGYTDFNDAKPLIDRTNPTYNAWTVIRNEYGPGDSIYTQGIPAIKVTIAHEFHHGIQVGNYGLWQNDLWFYELTSTWMEQVVYPHVKDYYQYLADFFNNVDRPFNQYQTYSFAGYERCVFGIFVQNEYGTSIMKSIWENMAREEPIPAIEDAFTAIGKDPSSMFQLFGETNYFTGYRTALADDFNIVPYPLSGDYPLVKISSSGDLTQSGGGFSFSNQTALRLTEHYYQIYDFTDTIGLAIVNTNFTAAVNNDTTNFPFSTGISTSGNTSCRQSLTNGYCLFFSVTDHTNWGFIPFITGQTFVLKDNIPFPQPFNPSLQELKIPYSFSDASSVTLSIFSASGALLRRINSANIVGKYFVWNGKDGAGRTVSSGVYIYVLSDGSKSVVGKIALVRN
jgi:hypothetical protein